MTHYQALRLVFTDGVRHGVHVLYWGGHQWTPDPDLALGLSPRVAVAGCVNLAQALSGIGLAGTIARVKLDGSDPAAAMGRGALPVTP